MFDLNLAGPIRFLFLGAHCDDIEIGCGGTIVELARKYPDASFYWVTFSSTPDRASETSACATALLGSRAKRSVEILEFKESHFPSQIPELKAKVEEIKEKVEPHVVFTHYREDRHQDHVTVSDLTWNSFRDHVVLEYEIPKFDGDLGIPNFFVPIPRETVDQKIKALLECYESQHGRYWFTDETFLALLRLRGIEARSKTGYAEAFYARKITLAI